jgi:hypothetical protein
MNFIQKIVQYFHLYSYKKHWNIIKIQDSRTYPDFIREMHILDNSVIIIYQDPTSNKKFTCIIPIIQYKNKSTLTRVLKSLHMVVGGRSHSPRQGYILTKSRLKVGVVLFTFDKHFIRPFIIKDLKNPHLSTFVSETNEIDDIESTLSEQDIVNAVKTTI